MKKISLLILGLIAFYQFSFAQCSVTMSYTIGANGSVSYSAVAAPVSTKPCYYWNFYDGSSGYGSNVTHSFAANGAHMVCVTYIDSVSLCSSNACDTVLITNAGTAGCHTTFSSLNNDSLFSFTPTSWGGIAPYTYQWSVLDTVAGVVLYTGSAVNPSVVVPVNHYLAVTLYSTDSAGCVSSSRQVVALNWTQNNTACNALFTIFPDTVNTHKYYGYNYSTGTNLNYYWNWGDGSYDTTAYPTHAYATSGFYTVCLAVVSYSNSGCSDSVCINYFVNRMETKNAMRSIQIKAKNATGVQDIATANTSFSIAPNPASQSIIISELMNNTKSIQIFDLMGRKILEQTVTNKNAELINIADWNNGIYFIKAIGENGKVMNAKFIKE